MPGRSLRSSEQFRRVYARGRRGRRDGIIVYACRTDADETRVGLVVGGKVGGAVTRNRVKRRLREIVRGYHAEPGFDIVIHAEPSVVPRSFSELDADVSAALARAGVGRGAA